MKPASAMDRHHHRHEGYARDKLDVITAMKAA
jgi:hypothetical protein